MDRMSKPDIVKKFKGLEDKIQATKAQVRAILTANYQLQDGETQADAQKRKLLELYFSLED